MAEPDGSEDGSDVPKPITKRILMTQRPNSRKEMMQIETLIASLNRSMELLSSDIEIEENRVRVHDVSDPA